MAQPENRKPVKGVKKEKSKKMSGFKAEKSIKITKTSDSTVKASRDDIPMSMPKGFRMKGPKSIRMRASSKGFRARGGRARQMVKKGSGANPYSVVDKDMLVSSNGSFRFFPSAQTRTDLGYPSVFSNFAATSQSTWFTWIKSLASQSGFSSGTTNAISRNLGSGTKKYYNVSGINLGTEITGSDLDTLLAGDQQGDQELP